MHHINEVTIEHISRLDESQLGRLLERLLYLEAGAYNLPNPTISVPQNEKSKDGGVDGKIELSGTRPTTPRLSNNITAFQNKATDMEPQKCYDEILLPKKDGEPRKLKPEVEKVISAGASYILFTTQANTDKMNSDRVAKLREAMEHAGITNYSSLDIRIFDANKIKDWTNEYITAVDLVQGFAGITKPNSFRDWEITKADINADSVAFQIDKSVAQHIDTIRNNVVQQKAIRVIGHSGIGKTRLVFEAFRPKDDLGKILNAQFIYCDIGVEGRYERLENFITSHRNTQNGILIIDNCDAERHKQLSNLVKSQGNFKIITLGFDDNKSVSDVKIKLDRQDQRELVKQIIQQQLGQTHSSQDVDYVARLCEGYPWMAVRYCEVINQGGITNFDKFFEDHAIEKLVFGRKPVNHTELKILRACSVFSAFGFVDDSFANVINENYKKSLNDQTEFIRTKVCDEEVTSTQFREACLKFKDDDIIEQRGVYYIVKPTVLAIQLAAKWLTVTPADKIKEIIEDLKKVQLEQKFLDRLTDLDQLDKARDIVEELFGMNSSFGSAEVLNTEWGSLLFRYVVEVNPEVTNDALVVAFKDWSKSDLFNLSEGRRNLVWALEKLCFHRATFFESTQFLFRLAVSENENWANNASGQITQLFQRFLPGTEADYKERTDILKWALNQNDPDFTRLAISCMSRVFIPQGQHHRGGGAEQQGSGRPLVDFTPKTWEEIFQYWDDVLGLMLPIINSGGENGEYALKTLARGVRTLISENASKIIFKYLDAVTFREGPAWIDIRSELQKTLKYEHITSGEIYNEINRLLDEFKPKNIQEEFLANVILPEWTYEVPEVVDGIRIDKQQQKAENFAVQLVEKNIDWKEYLPSLLEGEQRQAFNFGRKIGEIDQNAKSTVLEALTALKDIPIEKQNPGFVMGLISGINDMEFYDRMFQYMISDAALSIYAVNLSKLNSFSVKQLFNLFQLIDKGQYTISIFDNFRFGKPLDYLQPKDLDSFIDKIASYGLEGEATAFSVLFMHCFNDEPRWNLHKEKLRELIIADNLLLVKTRSLEAFYWTTTSAKLLRESDDSALADKIAVQVSEFCHDENFHYGFDTYLYEVLEILFEKYFPVVWPSISETLDSNYLTVMHAKSLFGTKNGNNGREGVLFKFPQNYDTIYQWLANNDRGRLTVANMMPFASTTEVTSSETDTGVRINIIHPFAKGFLDRFGAEEKVLDELAANLGTFGTVGGSEWYFQLLMDLVSHLKDHTISELKIWARKAYKYYEKSLKLETLENQNHALE
ncbi:hypothetical protein BEL04_18085 [Mucilaginibacter sp. PPCGB 2223]|uniref:hypothetical protein n=1 Tax=Mucilaginibacter sp. PPCGB 2223 TaxID=1886027 RepID=UPI0008253E28|nr:hypothetical protein [Mucilaginibacter sp. PPCGB 2223]OCX51912.1 hypothetical protein BEL04_18085 [Mucilaginibacter sp. PPCGB 2223]